VKKIKLYLAGSRGDWREKVKADPRFKTFSPFNADTNLAQFTVQDLAYVDKADTVLIYISYPVYGGACVEAGYASAKGKPVILVWKLDDERVEPLLLGVSRGVYTSLDKALDFICRINEEHKQAT
jgi:nucleoside 2-deoxyribosyltransferase